MAKKKATLDKPVTLDPRVAAGVRLASTTLIHSNDGVRIDVELLDAGGNAIGRKVVNPVTAESQALVQRLEDELLALALATLGLAAKKT